MTTIARLNVLLGADASELDSALSGLKGRFERVGASMMDVGSKLTTRVTLPLAAVGAASVKMAIDAEESANKFNVVMGDSADSVRQRLEALTETIPLTRAEMEHMASGIQDMLVPMGLARDEAAGMSADYVELAGDLASFNNVGTAEVLEAIKSALAGSSEPMRRFGVDTRETRLQAIALSEGIVDQGEKLDNTTRALAVFAAIQADSADAMGDAARTAEDTANQIRFLTRDVKQLGLDIGAELIPMITPVVSGLRDMVGALGDTEQGVKKTAAEFGVLVAVLGPVLQVAGFLITKINVLAAVLSVTLAGAIVGIRKNIERFNGALDKLRDWLGHGEEAVEDFGESSDAMLINMQWQFNRTLPQIQDEVIEWGETIVRETESNWQDLVRANRMALTDIRTDSSTLWADMYRDLQRREQQRREDFALHWRAMNEKAVEGAGRTAEAITAGIEPVESALRQPFEDAVPVIVDEMTTLSDAIDGADGVIRDFEALGIHIPKELEGVLGHVDEKWGAITNLLGEDIDLSNWRSWADSLLGIFDETKEGASAVIDTFAGSTGGIGSAGGEVAGGGFGGNIVGDLISGGLGFLGGVAGGVITSRATSQSGQAQVNQMRLEGAYLQSWAQPRLDLLAPITNAVTTIQNHESAAINQRNRQIELLRNIERNTAAGIAAGAGVDVGATNQALGQEAGRELLVNGDFGA